MRPASVLVILDTRVGGLQHRSRRAHDLGYLEALHGQGEQQAVHAVHRNGEIVQASRELAPRTKYGRPVQHGRRHQGARVAHLGWVEEKELPTRSFSDPEVRRVGPAGARPARARRWLLVLRAGRRGSGDHYDRKGCRDPGPHGGIRQ